MSKARDIASAPIAPSTVSATELGYVDGVTSAIQTQIDSKIGSASAINPTIVDAKGDIIAATAADTVARLAVGTNGQVLTAASCQATGLQWATVAAGSNWSLLNAGGTSLTGTSVSITGISGMDKLMIIVDNASVNTSFGPHIYLQFNSDTGSNYNSYGFKLGNQATWDGGQHTQANEVDSDRIYMFNNSQTAGSSGSSFFLMSGCNSAGYKIWNSAGNGTPTTVYTNRGYAHGGFYTGTSTISSVQVGANSGSFDFGKIYIYGSA